MKQTKSFIFIAVIVMLSLSAVFSPGIAGAADPKVSDGYNSDGQSEGVTDAVEESEAAPAEPEEKSFVVIIGQLILYTLLIVFMIYGLIKFLSMRQKNLQPNQAVRLMGGTPLGNNKSLQLVKVGDRILLIGVGDQVTLIKEIEAEDEITGIEKNLENQASALLPGTISSFIKEKIGGKKNADEEKNSGFENLFKQSLDKQKQKQERLKKELQQLEDDKEDRSS